MITEGLAVSLWRPVWELSDGQRCRLMSPSPQQSGHGAAPAPATQPPLA